MTSALFSWYLDNAGLLFGTCIVGAVLGEKLVRWAAGRDLEARSTATSIISGGAFLLAKTLLGKLVFLGLSLWLYEQHRFFTLDLTNPLVWLGVFLIRDFVYYWVHRAEHTVNVLWASHLVHHSPETIGMATAVRVPWMEAIYKPFFSLWLPLLGFNPLAAVAMDVFAATLSQLQHTECFRNGSTSLVGRIFVTPSTHRVHHGYNAEYLDKNFGAVLIVWDRMFGTYEPEVAPVLYGVGADDRVLTGTDALMGGFPRLIAATRQAPTAAARFNVLFGRPGTLPKPGESAGAQASGDVVSVPTELGVDLLHFHGPRNDEWTVLRGDLRLACVEQRFDDPKLRLGIAARAQAGNHGDVRKVLAPVGDPVLVLPDASDAHPGNRCHTQAKRGLVKCVKQGFDVVMLSDVRRVFDDEMWHEFILWPAPSRAPKRHQRMDSPSSSRHAAAAASTSGVTGLGRPVLAPA
jgi:sterol desaturase/sphingolipid hydroxylase (fatty acid hydroxylase superfamily)